MKTGFERAAEDFLTHLGFHESILESEHSQGQIAPGLDRTGSGFDYLFLTASHLCFLQPNPPVLCALRIRDVQEIESSGPYLLITPADDAQMISASATKGFGRKLRNVDSETMPASVFFTVWPSWRGARWAFIDSLVRAAHLQLDESSDDTLTNLRVSVWVRPTEVVAPRASAQAAGPSQNRGDEAPSLSESSQHALGKVDRFAVLDVAFLVNPEIGQLIDSIHPDMDLAEVPAVVVDAFSQEAWREFPPSSHRILVKAMMLGWVAAARLLTVRGYPVSRDVEYSKIQRRYMAALEDDLGIEQYSDAGYYVLNRLLRSLLPDEIVKKASASPELVDLINRQFGKAIFLGASVALASTSAESL